MAWLTRHGTAATSGLLPARIDGRDETFHYLESPISPELTSAYFYPSGPQRGIVYPKSVDTLDELWRLKLVIAI